MKCLSFKYFVKESLYRRLSRFLRPGSRCRGGSGGKAKDLAAKLPLAQRHHNGAVDFVHELSSSNVPCDGGNKIAKTASSLEGCWEKLARSQNPEQNGQRQEKRRQADVEIQGREHHDEGKDSP